MKNTIIIPARLESTRLPNKLLIEINGKSILERVYERCMLVKNSKVFISTDSKKILNHCASFTKNIIMTSKKHESGTDRIAEAATKIECENIVNVQGDEPFINPKLINKIFKELNNSNSSVISAVEKINNYDELKNPNNVKVVISENNYALYFSRSIIPFDREENINNELEDKYFNKKLYFKHVGIYGYKKEILKDFCKMKKSKLENIEKLEQLRLIENGIKIKLVYSEKKALGIDTIEDFENAKKIIYKNETQ